VYTFVLEKNAGVVSAMGRTGKVEEDPDKKAAYGCQLAPRLPEGKKFHLIRSVPF
jgi:hypothetical protein